MKNLNKFPSISSTAASVMLQAAEAPIHGISKNPWQVWRLLLIFYIVGSQLQQRNGGNSSLNQGEEAKVYS